MELDRTDRQILSVLQRDGKISVADLASEVGLSPSPCWRRVRKLEESGVIRGYAAVLDAAQLGLGAVAYITLSLRDYSEASLARFNAFVQKEPRVIECSTVAGAQCFLLKVVAKDPEGLEAFLLHDLLGLGIIDVTQTSFVLRQNKMGQTLPVAE